MNNTHFALFPSPCGDILAVRDGDVLVGLWFHGQSHAPTPPSSLVDDANSHPIFASLKEQLDEYFAGKRERFDVPYELRGTPWQQIVWAELEKIPYGKSVTYGQVASAVGKPGAAQAVGNAVGRNPISIVVPCHRVFPASGGIGGYGGGVERKTVLAKAEGLIA